MCQYCSPAIQHLSFLLQSEEDMKDVHSTLQRFLMALPLCSGNMFAKFGSTPIEGLRAAISSLCNTSKETIHEAVLATLWEGRFLFNQSS